MTCFLTRLFAVFGFLISLIILASIACVWFMHDKTSPEPQAVILALDFDQPITEQNEPSPLDLALQEEPTPLLDILHAIDKAGSDSHVKAIVAHFGTTQPSLAQAQEIRAALARFRAKGKMTYAFGSSYGEFGLSNRAYYLASGFENIWLQPIGSVGLTGLAIQSPFAKAALQKIGVEGDFMHREEYKSAMDTATRNSFAPPVRANMESLMKDLADQIAEGIAESRAWKINDVKNLMERGPYTDEEALKEGLVTRLAYEDELDQELQNKAGAEAKQVKVEDYLSFDDTNPASKPKATVALIYGAGLITDKDGGKISGDHIMGAAPLTEAFNAAAEDKDVKAILFRIDSPGGSPAASETIRRALVHAQSKGKPVIVSMGDVAASGGYWVAMNADEIIAEPGTITGSIGVIAGKFVLGDLMKKLGITWETLKTSDNAGLWSMMQNFSPAQRERVNAMLDGTYNAFLKNVSTARKIPLEKMPDIAKGRVWTGAQAVKIGLVDKLGGYDVALASIRKKLNLKDTDALTLEPFPPPETPAEKVMKLLKGFGVESAMMGSVLVHWQNMQITLQPLWAAVNRNPLAAQMPEAVLGAVR